MKKEAKEEIVEALEGKKEYEVTYKFSDIVNIIKAGSKEEAEEIADKNLDNGKYNPKDDTYCYEIEVEEVE